MKAVLLISHGSRYAKTKEEVSELAHFLRQKCDAGIFEYAFLELERPSIPEGVDVCVAKGATDIVVLLNFLDSGQHVDSDIPKIIQETQGRYPHVVFRVTMPVGQHPDIADIFLKLLKDKGINF